jgi:hypothetical protein
VILFSVLSILSPLRSLFKCGKGNEFFIIQTRTDPSSVIARSPAVRGKLRDEAILLTITNPLVLPGPRLFALPPFPFYPKHPCHSERQRGIFFPLPPSSKVILPV